jgi:ATP-dependent DNA helicase RecG
MTQEELIRLLSELRALPLETEWIEFKCNYVEPEEIGEYLSALANSASLHKKEAAYLIWGIEDMTHRVIGTDFKPRRDKVGNQELESWLALQLHPRIDFKIHEFMYEGLPLVLFEVQPSRHTPVRFRETEFIRIGSYKKKLKDFPEKERSLWLQLSQTPFEKGLASRNMSSDQVLSLIDYPAYFDLTGQNLPANKSGILGRLRAEKIITEKGADQYDIANLWAVLFAKRLCDFDMLARKAVRIIIYKGNNWIETIKEQVGAKGYTVGFEGLVDYINDQLPRNEQIGSALRKQVSMYPEIAVRLSCGD